MRGRVAALRRPRATTFWEGTCVVAAHQHLRSQGRPGFVDRDGVPNADFPDAEARIRWFAELGADLIDAAAAVAR